MSAGREQVLALLNERQKQWLRAESGDPPNSAFFVWPSNTDLSRVTIDGDHNMVFNTLALP